MPYENARRAALQVPPGFGSLLSVMAGGEPESLRMLRGDADLNGTMLERYAVVPDFVNPRVLLPLCGSEAALGVALAQHASGAASPFVRVAARGLHLANRMGLAPLLLRHRVTVAGSGADQRETRLHEFLAEVIGRRDFVTSMRIAPRRPNGKPVVQAISDDGTVLAYAKFGCEALTRRLVRHEAEVLDELAVLTSGSPLKVPRVLFSGAWRGIEALVLNPLVGQRLQVRSVSDLPVEMAIALAELRERSFAELGNSACWHRLAAQLEQVMMSLDEQSRRTLVMAREKIEDRWAGVNLPLGQCHGDWIPPNMSVARDGSYNLWDWELSEGDTPLGIDAMHFILQMELRSCRSAPATARRLCSLGREALLRLRLDPKQAPLLVALNLLRMIILYGEARRLAEGKDGDRRHIRVLQAVVERF